MHFPLFYFRRHSHSAYTSIRMLTRNLQNTKKIEGERKSRRVHKKAEAKCEMEATIATTSWYVGVYVLNSWGYSRVMCRASGIVIATNWVTRYKMWRTSKVMGSNPAKESSCVFDDLILFFHLVTLSHQHTHNLFSTRRTNFNFQQKKIEISEKSQFWVCFATDTACIN